MNPIEGLRDDLIRRFPGVSAAIDPPADESGRWHLDVYPSGGAPIVVEWGPGLSFGVSTAEQDDFGLKPDEAYPDARTTFDRVARLILAGGRTEPPAKINSRG